METEGVVEDILRLNIVGEPEGNAARSLFIIATNLLDAEVFFGVVPLVVARRHYKKRKKSLQE